MHRGTSSANGSPDRDLADRLEHTRLLDRPPEAEGPAAAIRAGVPIAGALTLGMRPPVPPADPPAGEAVPFYYSSKYARLDALPRALDYGRIERLATVRTYAGYVFDPPDGEGDPVNNALHLRAACARLRTDAPGENAALLLLDAFSLLVIEGAEALPASSSDAGTEHTSLRRAVRQIRTAYRRFMDTEPWPDLLAALTDLGDRLTAVHPGLEPVLTGLRQECVLYRTVRLLRGFNRHLLDEPSV